MAGWVADVPQPALTDLYLRAGALPGGRPSRSTIWRVCTDTNSPLAGRYLVPSERIFRRVLAAVDGDALDAATCGCAADVVRGDVPAARGSPPPLTNPPSASSAVRRGGW